MKFSLISFSYVDLRNREIDFIENVFENNQEYLIINVTENVQIQNNIFGVKMNSASVTEMDFEMGIICLSFLDALCLLG